MNTRLLQFLNAENITQAQFADSINVARAGVSHIIAGRNKPSWDFLLNMMNRYPDLNIEWLMTGKGKMYKAPARAEPSNSPKVGDQIMPDVGDTVFNQVEIPVEDDFVDTLPSQNHPFAYEGKAVQPETEVLKVPKAEPVRQRIVTKVIIFFDDGTFQER